MELAAHLALDLFCGFLVRRLRGLYVRLALELELDL